MHDRPVSFSDRLYATLLRLFPGDFHGEFAEEMQADFRDQRAHAAETGGRAAVALLCIRTTIDIIRRAPAEQLDVTTRDAVYALRVLRRNRWHTATAVLTLGLAIGVNTTIFSIVDGVLFRPLPYREPHKLVMLSSGTAGSDIPSALVPKLLAMALHERHGGLGDLAAIQQAEPLTLVGSDGAVSFSAAETTANLLDVLGVVPVRGRSFTNDDLMAPERGALLSYAAWITRFGADASIVDRVLTFEERPVRIVGVLPKDFVGPSLDAGHTDLLLAGESPYQGVPIDPWRELARYPIARLEPNVTLAAAQAEVDALVANLMTEHPYVPVQPGRRIRAELMELQVGLFESRRSALWALFGAAGLVLVIACANLANLLLARAASRQREMAVRSALGASRVRLIRQLVIESTILALAGGGVGVILARWSFNLTVVSVPPVFATLLPESLDIRAVGFCALVTGMSVLFFGIVPALRASQADLLAGLHDRRRVPVLERIRDGHVLVAAETLVVTVLVISAVLMLGSFARLRSATLGFDPGDLLSINLPRVRQDVRVRQLLSQITTEIQALPGVVSVAAEDVNPMGVGGWRSRQARLPDRRVVPAHRVSAGYFETIGLRLIAGRLPVEGEWRGDPAPAVVTEQVSHMMGGPQSALGTPLVLSEGENTRATVIGVVSNIRLRYDDRQPRQIVFVPFSDRWREPGLVVRTAGDQRGLDDRIRSILNRTMPRRVSEVAPARTQLARSLALPRFQAQLLSAFAILALLLAIVGIYGVLAQTVAGRTREIGIRMALGAAPRSVRRLVIAQGIAPVVVGLILGTAAGFWTVQVFSRYVHGVELRDPAFFVATAAIVLSTALAAAWIPAHRATRIDPATTLKTD
jgi:putative ABC transport system permease protein